MVDSMGNDEDFICMANGREEIESFDTRVVLKTVSHFAVTVRSEIVER